MEVEEEEEAEPGGKVKAVTFDDMNPTNCERTSEERPKNRRTCQSNRSPRGPRGQEEKKIKDFHKQKLL